MIMLVVTGTAKSAVLDEYISEPGVYVCQREHACMRVCVCVCMLVYKKINIYIYNKNTCMGV